MTNAFQANLPVFHVALQQWYHAHGRRHLPWRNTSDPYHIYVSEIMLQQTQVKTVLERFYGPFIKRFPTLAALAMASSEEVVKQWQGLGYYNRAGNLHKAAQLCGGQLPSEPEAILALPGIGRNTAHAIACFAFGAAVPVMEANVRRVLCRVFAMREMDEALLWKRAEELLDKEHPYEYNQAMMDIGALVCTKRRPQCSLCPLSIICRGKKAPELYPTPKKSKVVPVRHKIIVAFHDHARKYYLSCRTTRFLNGLYGFMEYEQGAKSVEFARRHYRLRPVDQLGFVTQTYSHFTLSACIYAINIEKSKAPKSRQWIKADLKEIMKLPLSKADLKVLEMLAAHRIA